MTILELAKIIRNSGCEISISPCEEYRAVYITARNKDKVVRYGVDITSAFLDIEEILDHTIKISVYQVKDDKQ